MVSAQRVPVVVGLLLGDAAVDAPCLAVLAALYLLGLCHEGAPR